MKTLKIEIDCDQGLPTHFCSFCGQYYEEAEFFIMGPDVSICSDCADFCTEILQL